MFSNDNYTRSYFNSLFRGLTLRKRICYFKTIQQSPYMNPGSKNKIWSSDETEAFYRNLLDQALQTIPATGAALVLGPMFVIRPPEENFALFEKAQLKLKEQGIPVFNQLPFVDYNLPEAPFNYTLKFEIFYKNLIESGKITACYLLPEWDKSEGTKSEIKYSENAGVPVFKL